VPISTVIPLFREWRPWKHKSIASDAGSAPRGALQPRSLGIQCVGKCGNYFILHLEEVGHGLVEPISPKMGTRFGVDQLHIHPQPTGPSLDRTFEHVIHIQLPAELLHVYSLALECERRVAGDDERAVDPRQISGQALGDSLGK